MRETAKGHRGKNERRRLLPACVLHAAALSREGEKKKSSITTVSAADLCFPEISSPERALISSAFCPKITFLLRTRFSIRPQPTTSLPSPPSFPFPRWNGLLDRPGYPSYGRPSRCPLPLQGQDLGSQSPLDLLLINVFERERRRRIEAEREWNQEVSRRSERFRGQDEGWSEFDFRARLWVRECCGAVKGERRAGRGREGGQGGRGRRRETK